MKISTPSMYNDDERTSYIQGENLPSHSMYLDRRGGAGTLHDS